MTPEAVKLRLASAEGAPLRIHLIGVAGSGMSGLASLCLARGHSVSGSDKVESAETKRLQQSGLLFSSPHTAEAVKGCDAVIYSSAVKTGNQAYDAALAGGIPLLRRAEALAALMQGKNGVLVAGTHGKTTTSSLLAHMLRLGGLQPSHYVGAEIPILGTNAHWDPEGKWMVAEGDESDGTLVHFQPEASIVLNIEEEHLDHYADLSAIQAVFQRLLENTKRMAVYCGEDAGAVAVCSSHPGAISYGWRREFAYSAGVLSSDPQSSQFSVFRHGELLGRVELNIPGRHNVLNALAVIAVASELGVEFGAVQEALRTFRGARRRFERRYKGTHHEIVDDYGHHPTEVAATLEAARAQRPGRLVVLFQPHRYTRTQRFADDFGRVFAAADLVFVTDVYPASEKPIPGVSGWSIVDAISRFAPDTEAHYVPKKSETHSRVGQSLRAGDLLLTLGAGDVHLVADRLGRDLEVLEALEECMAGEHGPCHLYEPMSEHTTMRVGGPAQYWIEPHSVKALVAAVRYAKENNLPLRVVGRGSNMLVRDGGIPGVVLHPVKGEFSKLEVRGHHIEAGAGVRLKAITGAARVASLGGFEWMEGIPGNVGGSLRMNAGAMGAETFDQVVSVTYLDWEACEVRVKTRDEFLVQYRSVPALEHDIALSAIFEGKSAQVEEIDAKLEASKDKRKLSQPIGASAGCIFKNAASTPAGKLVEELGLKNGRVGAARVSEIHGNFIVNDGQATASEVLELIARIQAKALDERKIELHTEVRIVGEDPPAADAFVR